QQRIGRGRVAVAIVLQVEPAKPRPEVGGDHAFDDHLPGNRLAAAQAADRHRRVIGQGQRWGEQERGEEERDARARAGAAVRHGRSAARRGPETRTPPWGGVSGGSGNAAYLRLSSIQSTVPWTCSTVSAGLPPFGGNTPALPAKPSTACL